MREADAGEWKPHCGFLIWGAPTARPVWDDGALVCFSCQGPMPLIHLKHKLHRQVHAEEG